MSFHSTLYEWLVVAGAQAKFRGEGTIKGAPSPEGDNYQFMLWAGDGDPDTFRIKIWYEEGYSDVIVYDNAFGQPISGGSITVHMAND